MNSDAKKVWVNPDGHALSFLKRNKPKRETRNRKGTRMAEKEAEAPASEVSIVRTPVEHPIVAPAIDGLGLPTHSASSAREIAKLQEIFEQTMAVFDLSRPEGILDSVFGRPEHRIQKKIERAELLGRYTDAYVAQLCRFRTALEELAKANEVKRQEYLSRVRAGRELAEEQTRIQLIAPKALQEQEVEDARAKAEIATYERQTHQPARDPLEVARRRRAMKAELYLQELETAAEVAGEAITAAKAQAIEVYRDLRMTKGEKRARILAILDAFGLDQSVLPPAIQELLEEEETYD